MANREWFITKVVGAVLGIITIVSICVGAANIVVNLQNDVTDIEVDIEKLDSRVDRHIDDDSEMFSKVDGEIDALKEKNHALELIISEQAIIFSYIKKELEDLNNKFDQFEVAE